MVVRGLIRPHEERLSRLLRIIDFTLVFGLLYVIATLYDDSWKDLYIWAAFLSGVAFLLMGELAGLYRPGRRSSFWLEVNLVFRCWLHVVPLPILVAFLRKNTTEYSRVILLTWFVAVPVVISLWNIGRRMVLGYFRGKGYNQRTVAVAGVTQRGFEFCRMLLENQSLGMQLVGVFDDLSQEKILQIPWDGIPYGGSLDALVEKVRDETIDRVYIALPLKEEDRIRDLIGRLSDTTTSVYVVPNYFLFDLMTARWSQLGDQPAISVFDTPFHEVEGALKRVEDVVLTLFFILPLIALPMALIALAVKLTSSGPVIFRQTRYGLNGEPIKV
jgi:putative colanic acid biosysnthesis UDP-glucose lipid carrier transferase